MYPRRVEEADSLSRAPRTHTGVENLGDGVRTPHFVEHGHAVSGQLEKGAQQGGGGRLVHQAGHRLLWRHYGEVGHLHRLHWTA